MQKLCGLGSDNVPINAVFTQLFNIMGVWPAIYTAILVPSAKSGNKVRAAASLPPVRFACRTCVVLLSSIRIGLMAVAPAQHVIHHISEPCAIFHPAFLCA